MKILVAEGALRNRIVMADGLRMKGHTVHVVDNGIEALQRLRTSRFDVVFLDDRLPLLDGRSVLKVLREYLGLESQPRVVLTSDEPAGLPYQVPEGADATLSKPPSLAEMERLVWLLQPQSEQHPRPVAPAQVLDGQKITALLGEMSDAEFLRDLVETFGTHGMHLVDKMHKDANDGRWDDVIDSSRALQDAGASLAAGALIRACARLEEERDRASLDDVSLLFFQTLLGLWHLLPARVSLEEQTLDGLIYILDDEEHNVLLLEKMLKKQGFTRVVSTTFPDYFRVLMSQRTPDLVLLDLHMPGISGLELLEEVNPNPGSSARTPVLVLTADGRPDVRRRALQRGARDFVNKPFDPPEVITRIRNLMESCIWKSELLQKNRNLEELVQKRTLEVRERQMDILRRLGMAAEYRDDQTGGHIRRVGRYAAILADSLGLAPETCDCILHAAQLHDIGNVAIPDSVLLKPGKLKPEEREIMQTHTTLGAEILRGGDCEMLQMAEEIALSHHERWDGSGYPNGQAGALIPLSGRIVAICDAFDALTCDRPYKKRCSVEEAVQELRDKGGAQFDPVLVEHFLLSLPRILKVFEQHTPPTLPDVQPRPFVGSPMFS